MDSDYSKPKSDFSDDIRQTFIVAKNEIVKFVSGKKILIFGIIGLATLVLLSVVMFGWGSDDMTTEGGVSTYLSFISLLMLLGATLFSSVTLVSEFEERTALVLFTKPIRKGSIFVGKFIAAYLLNMIFVIVYYLITALMVGIKTGGFTSNIFPSLGYCAVYIFALTGIAILFSALLKKSSSASILTFIFILLVPSLILSVMMIIDNNFTDPYKYWYILDEALLAVTDSISGPVENGPRAALVMFIWGLIPTVASYFLFRKREV